jgi:hypothetical protein
MGPCVVHWADRGSAVSSAAWFRALRNWQHAGEQWAIAASGVNLWDRPVIKWQMLTRTSKPWSREYLLRIGLAEIVDYFEGRLAKRPPNILPWDMAQPV